MSSIFYFLIADNATKKVIGNYFCAKSGSIQEYNQIRSEGEVLLKQSELLSKNNKYKLGLDSYFLFYYLSSSNTFYYVAVEKNSEILKNENVIYELIEDIEHQGIRLQVDKKGVLTSLGNQNLKFQLMKYQESSTAKPNPEKKIETLPITPVELKNEDSKNIKVKDSEEVISNNNTQNYLNNMASIQKKIKMTKFIIYVISLIVTAFIILYILYQN